MKFKLDVESGVVEIYELTTGDTFIDIKNFSEEEVFMVVKPAGYDCHIEFDDGVSDIVAVNLTTGELRSYTRDEEVVQVKTEEIKYKIE